MSSEKSYQKSCENILQIKDENINPKSRHDFGRGKNIFPICRDGFF
jgi:hypothetical protein